MTQRLLVSLGACIFSTVASTAGAQIGGDPNPGVASMNSGIASASSNGTLGGLGGAGVRNSAARFNDSSQRGLTIQPRVQLGASYSDNIDYSTVNRRSDIIFEISPGLRVTNNSGNVRGFFDYSLQNFRYLQGTLPNSIQQALNTAFTIQALPGHLFLDVAGQRSRNAVSVFGVQPADSSRNIDNSTQLSTYQFSPYFVGKIASEFDYEIRFRKSVTNSGDALADAATNEWLGVLRQNKLSRRFTIETSIAHSKTDYKNNSDYSSTQFLSAVNWIINPQFYLTGYLGRERNNYITLDQQAYSNYGAGFSWRPSTRTYFEGRKIHRFFGDGHFLAANYRVSRIAFRYMDNRDVSLASANRQGDPNAIVQLLNSQFGLTEPDPARRAQLVDNYLRDHGLVNRDGTQVILTNSPVLRRDQQLSVGVLGIRRSFTLFGGRTSSESLGTASVGGDFSDSARIVQNQIGASATQQMPDRVSVGLAVSTQSASGDTPGQKVRTRSVSFAYRKQLNIKTSFDAGAIRTFFASSESPYNETQIFGRLVFRF